MADSNNNNTSPAPVQATSAGIIKIIVGTLCTCAVISLIGVIAAGFFGTKQPDYAPVLERTFVMAFTAITALLASTKTLQAGNGSNGNGNGVLGNLNILSKPPTPPEEPPKS